MIAESIRRKEFEQLILEVTACRKCHRMNSSERVFGHSCGGLNASVMFVGEAPGRLGADNTLIPFHGDQAGHNFESFLLQVGINRYESFVTNAVLCNPRDDKGNNSTPTPEEVRNCSGFFRRQLDLVAPKVVATLGSTALRAAALIEPHGLAIARSVRSPRAWYGRTLIPLYHPGQRAMVHRSFSNQLSDYQLVSEALRIRRRSNKRAGKYSAKVAAIVELILSQKPRMSYFALHKLFYLIEVAARKELGARLTNSYIVRQKDGPYCVDLHVAKLKAMVPPLKVEVRHNKLTLQMARAADLFSVSSPNNELDESERKLVTSIVDRYGDLSDVELKRRSYLTREMRDILRAEKRGRTNMFNVPLLPLTPEEAES
jgi:uracil-DNA glycosylase family 4